MSRHDAQRLADITAAMRDRLAHRYFDTSHAIIAATIATDLPELDIAVARLTARAVDNTGN